MRKSRRTWASSTTRSISNRNATGSFGFHIHDVLFPGRGPLRAGTGTVNFAALKPMVKPEHIKVFEFSPAVTVKELNSGIAHVKNIWGTD